MALHFRTIDGSNNNLADPTMNQTDTAALRISTVARDKLTA